MRAKFGPAGNSLSFAAMGYKGSLDVPEYIEKMGVSAVNIASLPSGKDRDVSAVV